MSVTPVRNPEPPEIAKMSANTPAIVPRTSPSTRYASARREGPASSYLRRLDQNGGVEWRLHGERVARGTRPARVAQAIQLHTQAHPSKGPSHIRADGVKAGTNAFSCCAARAPWELRRWSTRDPVGSRETYGFCGADFETGRPTLLTRGPGGLEAGTTR